MTASSTSCSWPRYRARPLAMKSRSRSRHSRRIAWKAPRTCNGPSSIKWSFSSTTKGVSMNSKTVGEVFQTRRDLLKLGGLGLLGASVDGVWPLKISAAEGGAAKVHPRGTARNVLFYEISGAISHVESFDFKENSGTPKDLDIHKVKDDLYLSKLLFPKFEKHLDTVAISRSLLTHEAAHSRAHEYH